MNNNTFVKYLVQVLRLVLRVFSILLSPVRVLAHLSYYLRSEIALVSVKTKGFPCLIGKNTKIIHGEYVTLGNHVSIGPYSRVETIPRYSGQTLSPSLVIQDGVSMGWFTHIGCAKYVFIEKDTLIASNVYISDHNHGYSSPDNFKTPPVKTQLEIASVRIGQRCWIGENVCILPGVTIGNDCIIGAGSIVTRSIPPGTIAVGSPARPIKQRNKQAEWCIIAR